MNDNEVSYEEILIARSYQTEIVEQAKSENLIVCLPTGSGKTFIAVTLIKELSPITRRSLSDNGKRTILLVKTVELARQHHTTITKYIEKSDVSIYYGSSGINLQDTTRWKNEFETHRILIFTAQIFLNILTHNIFSLDKVNLLIFDECHHATGDDPYASIMKDHYRSCKDRPRILGLTASITGQKIESDQLEKAAKDLENILQARIETGSDQMEINRNSTFAIVKQPRCANYEQNVCSKVKLVMTIFKELKSLSAELGKRKNNKNESENNPSNLIGFQPRTLDQIKSHLENIIHIGYDLGLYGLSLGIKSLRNYFKSPRAPVTNQNEQDLYDKIMSKLDSLINDQLKELPDNRQIRFSDKVLKLVEYIKQNQTGQTIVFVERVYTATFLCQVLREILGNSIQIKYLAGSKVGINNESVSTKYQREVVDEFRDKRTKVLISTAIIEEGLDVPACNLVIRFNKPQNFSSYIQSKGRARVTTERALFVLLRDESDLKVYSQNSEEYENYERMEKKLKRNFKTDGYEDSSSDDDRNSLEPYRLGNGVKINGIYAVQIIYKYCAVLGNGQILPPHFYFKFNQSNKFQCTLAMPGNCPIREDMICENKNKRLAKQECCLKMIEKLHQINELDDRCLPIRHDQDSATDDDNEIPNEIIHKQIAYFPLESDRLSSHWHLYKINILNNHELGFITPCEQIRVPTFKIYGNDCEFVVDIVYLKSIDFKQYQEELGIFCQYIFEDVFDNMNIRSDKSILKFDLEHSSFQLLPCLLTQSGEIDHQRMISICTRKSKLIQNPSELDVQEVYTCLNSLGKQFYTMDISNDSPLKQASSIWEHKKRLSETINTYADHFEYKIPGIQIQQDFTMAKVKPFKKQRINYLKNDVSDKTQEKELKELSIRSEHYPIEVLRYAPLNQFDFELIYKLPTILTRISQLSYIEQLRKLLVTHLLLNDVPISSVTFSDSLLSILSPNQSSVLPLKPLNYNSLLINNCQVHLSFDLLFQSITRHSADEMTDMENLEILGDCFLKLAMSMSLYHQYPNDNSGKLTSKKDRQVSNKNLYQLAIKKELINYLFADAVKYRGKDANWLPPGYYPIDQETADRYLKQKPKAKAFADMIEALIGSFLMSTDYFTTIKFMDWLGLPVIPKDKDDQIMKTPSILYPGLSDTMDEVTKRIEEFFFDRAFNEIEEKIDYRFKNKAYLIAAYTHPSYSNNNRLTACYERLEYLGDAVLDFLVVRCIFVEHYKDVTPSRVTDIRHDLSNNGRLAYFLVSRDLDKNILHISEDLFYQIKIYLGEESRFTNKNQSTTPNDIDQWADPKAPKALADVFEALVGAIFLDSGYSLDTVWKVIEPILRQYINQSIKHPNLNPIRSFFERKGTLLNEYKDDNGVSICHIKFPNEQEFTGCGKNKKLAKHAACQNAMNSLKSKPEKWVYVEECTPPQ